MKLASLKIVTNEQITQRPAAAIIEDARPPPIHALALEPKPPVISRRLDVDKVLAGSLPKTIDEILSPKPVETLS